MPEMGLILLQLAWNSSYFIINILGLRIYQVWAEIFWVWLLKLGLSRGPGLKKLAKLSIFAIFCSKFWHRWWNLKEITWSYCHMIIYFLKLQHISYQIILVWKRFDLPIFFFRLSKYFHVIHKSANILIIWKFTALTNNLLKSV